MISLNEYAQAIGFATQQALTRTSCGRTFAQVLLATHNGTHYPLDLACLDRLDAKNLETAISIILDRMTLRLESHEVIANGDEIFRQIRKRWPQLHVNARIIAQHNLTMLTSRSQLFTEAWRRAVEHIGEEKFGPLCLSTATDFRDLSPIHAEFVASLSCISPGQRQFHIAAYSFYNAEVASKWARKYGMGASINDLTLKMDENLKDIIASLMINYTGW